MPDISKLLSAKSVAVVGASSDTTKLRGMLFEVLCRNPYEGRIYPVTPSHAEVRGHKAYPRVADIPEQVDLAVLAIPAEGVIDEVRRCGEAGVGAAAILASGFAEQAGPEGEAMQRELQTVIRQYDMAVTGPNSLGFVNFANHLCPTFSPALFRASLPLMPEWHHEGGRIAVVAQSGAIGFGMYDRGRLRELPYRYVVTTGNEAGLHAFDIVDYMLDEGETDVFLLFLEDIRNAAVFRRVAEKALKAGKPILVTKIGRSQASLESAVSHTGAMAGSDRVNRAVLEAYGVTLCDDFDQLVDTAAAFFHNRTKLPKGRRIGITAGSGGGGGWIADACDAAGLEVPALDPETRKKLDAVLPPFGSSRNPVDGTAGAIGQIGYAELTRMTTSSPIVDAGLMVTSARATHHYEKERDKFAGIGRDGQKPVIVWTYTWPTQETIAFFANAGLPLLTNLSNAAGALAAMRAYAERREAFVAPLANDQCGTASEADAAEVRAARTEFQARALLAAHGVGSFQGELAATREATMAAASAIEAPAVLKIQSPDIPHKSEANGIALNIRGAEAAGAAHDRLIAAAKAYRGDARIEGVLVEPMAKAGREVILGIQNDRIFGPMVLIGLGGIFTEILKDTVLIPPTGDAETAKAAIRRLKGAAILEGARGQAPADIDALARTIVALSHFAMRFAAQIDSVDINPVFVHDAGEGVSIVDALVVTTPSDA